MEENVLSTSPGLHQTPGLDKEDADVGDGLADPDSPNSKSDTTTSSSEGVLVEHPVNAYQVHFSSYIGHSLFFSFRFLSCRCSWLSEAGI